MPRPMLMKNALRFIRRNRARFIKPSVEGVCGIVSTTKSARGSSESSAAGSCSSATPGGASPRRASTPMTCIPNAAASRPVSAPIPPTPTISIVASGRCTTPVSCGAGRHSRFSCCGRYWCSPLSERENVRHDVRTDMVIKNLAEVRHDRRVRDQLRVIPASRWRCLRRLNPTQV